MNSVGSEIASFEQFPLGLRKIIGTFFNDGKYHMALISKKSHLCFLYRQMADRSMRPISKKIRNICNEVALRENKRLTSKEHQTLSKCFSLQAKIRSGYNTYCLLAQPEIVLPLHYLRLKFKLESQSIVRIFCYLPGQLEPLAFEYRYPRHIEWPHSTSQSRREKHKCSPLIGIPG